MKIKKNVLMLGGAIVVLCIVVITSLLLNNKPTEDLVIDNEKLDVFAKCISESGADMYGAYWCGHCNDQKEMFGKSAELLPYNECSTTEGEQTEVCKDAGISLYPTWILADGQKITGRLSFEKLSDYTGCKLE